MGGWEWAMIESNDKRHLMELLEMVISQQYSIETVALRFKRFKRYTALRDVANVNFPTNDDGSDRSDYIDVDDFMFYDDAAFENEIAKLKETQRIENEKHFRPISERIEVLRTLPYDSLEVRAILKAKGWRMYITDKDFAVYDAQNVLVAHGPTAYAVWLRASELYLTGVGTVKE